MVGPNQAKKDGNTIFPRFSFKLYEKVDFCTESTFKIEQEHCFWTQRQFHLTLQYYKHKLKNYR